MALDARVAVGSIGAIELVACSQPGKFGDVVDIVEESYWSLLVFAYPSRLEGSRPREPEE